MKYLPIRSAKKNSNFKFEYLKKKKRKERESRKIKRENIESSLTNTVI